MLRPIALVVCSAFLGVNALAEDATNQEANSEKTPDRDSRAELSLSNDTMQLRYFVGGDKVNAGANNQASAGFFISEDRDLVLDGELLFPINVHTDVVSVMVGPRAYAALLKEENNDVMAFSLGAEVRVPLNRPSGLAVVGHAFYAPDILTFGSADNLTDFDARIEFQATPRLLVFGGMRWFEFDLTEGGGKETLQDELFVGGGWQF